ncbi:MAG: hypothetical protein JNK21_16185 [Rhodospirillaceae bacterium]|nr:hypothetical protein [Rhodospirillaceae bacterium]
MQRFTKVAFTFALLLAALSANAWGKDLAFAFATAEEGRAILTARDDYVQRLSPFDRAAKMKTDRDLTEQEYLTLVGQNALDWPADEKAMVQAVLADVGPRVNALNLSWPDAVMFVKTTGAEEGDAAYTRANAIFLPPGRLSEKARAEMPSLIVHELFHVLSRHSTALRDRLYAAIGFTPCGEPALPPKLARVKITNPDAPVNQHCITLSVAGKPARMMPLIYSSVEKYDVAKGGAFFQYLRFGFVEIADGPGGGLANDTVVPFQDTAGFLEQVGRNTQYIIHPEEILADNFSYLVLGKPDLPSPEIIAKMKAILTQ